MKRYKLVDQQYRTRAGEFNEITWRVGETHTATGSGGLCTDGVIHSYETALLAVLLNPTHAEIQDPRLIQVECSELVEDDGLKGGHKSCTMVKEIKLPKISTRKRVLFAIECVLAIPNRAPIPVWDDWVHEYKSDKAGLETDDAAAKAAREAAFDAYLVKVATEDRRGKAVAVADAAYAAYSAACAATCDEKDRYSKFETGNLRATFNAVRGVSTYTANAADAANAASRLPIAQIARKVIRGL